MNPMMLGKNPPRLNAVRAIAAMALTLIALSSALGKKTTQSVHPPPTNKDSCVECHSQMQSDLAKPVAQMEHDIHRSRGFSCADCHGGDRTQDDPALAMSPRKGFLGKPAARDVPALCRRCHGDAEFMKKFNPSLRVDQAREFETSTHGKLLRRRDERAATCTSCHGAHGVLSSKDPQSPVYALNVAETCARCHSNAQYMRPYKVPTNQMESYRNSVHGRALYQRQDLSAPTCNDCHGSHGATPPGFDSVSNVCGQCHARQAELFRASVHKPAFEALQAGDCIQCHSNHGIEHPGDQMIGASSQSVCSSCHAEGDAGAEVAERMRAMIAKLETRIAASLGALENASKAGVEVSESRFELKRAQDALTDARVIIHAASPERLEEAIRPGLEITDKVQAVGERALEEAGLRRKWLGVSLAFILLFSGLLYAKVRQLERLGDP